MKPATYHRVIHSQTSSSRHTVFAHPHSRFSAMMCTFILLTLGAVAIAQTATVVDLSTPAAREQTVQALRDRAIAAKAEAVAMAQAKGWPIRQILPDGKVIDLQALVDGRPLYYTTCNVNAAISTAANLVRQTAPYSVDGSSTKAGIWDAGAVLRTHQEFGSRVTIKDSPAETDYHSTHVAGTIGAAGLDPQAKGMAPLVRIDSYDWDSDTSEMAAAAATAPGQTDKIYLSNHSYGQRCGWAIMGDYVWFGTYPEREDRKFGMYDDNAASWDAVAAAAPYYLIFKAAGNDRSDEAPPPGTLFYYYDDQVGDFVPKNYDPATDPFSDGYDHGGFDTIPDRGMAKNVLTVGAANDAVAAGVRSPSAGTMSEFSGWGPADDGRIKPDVVANGVDLYSSIDFDPSTGLPSNSSYYSLSGTSMATPNACGSSVLLIGYYQKLFPQQAMRSSTLKALIIHTADDVGNPGPDYSYGWGLMNTKAAADIIRNHSQFPGASYIVEGVRPNTNTPIPIAFAWDGTNPIRATLCWVDPAGTPIDAFDSATKVLVNDLELRIVGPGGSPTHQPYRLDRTDPAANATKGVNSVDNVEQVYIANPATSGVYTALVTRAGTLSGSQQFFSLILTGQAPDMLQVTPATPFSPIGVEGGPFFPSSATYTIRNTGGVSVNWGATVSQTWLQAAPSGGALGAGESVDVTVQLTAAANALAEGSYGDNIVFGNVSLGTSQLRGVSLTVEHFRTTPEVRNLVITPANPYTQDDLTPSFTFFDPNGHAQRSDVETQWLLFGVGQPQHNNANPLPASATTRGDSWSVEVRAFDAIDNEPSAWVVSDPVVIGNRLPVLQFIGNKQVDEGNTLQFTVLFSDPDGDVLTASADLSGLPLGPAFDPISGIFTWVTDYDSAGVYTATFRVTDNAPPVQQILETITITVTNVLPVVNPPGNVQASDGAFPDRIQVTFEPVGSAIKYKVYRNATDDFSTAELIGEWGKTTFDDFSIAQTSVGASQLTSGLSCVSITSVLSPNAATPQYYYWVIAVGPYSESVMSASDAGYVGSGAKEAVAAGAAPTDLFGRGTAGDLALLAFVVAALAVSGRLQAKRRRA